MDMKGQNIEVKGLMVSGRDYMGVWINYDWVGKEVFVNSVSYQGMDIKSLMSGEEDANLITSLHHYCIKTYL